MNTKPWLEIGKVVTTHGVGGELKVQPWADQPEDLLTLETLYIGRERRPVRVERSRVQKTMVLLKLRGVDTLADAAAYRNQILYADRADVRLPEGSFFIQDLEGLQVVDADSGRVYGRLTEVSQTGANDVYHVQGADGTMRYLPAIPEVVLKIDTDGGVVTIRPLKGLFDNED